MLKDISYVICLLITVVTFVMATIRESEYSLWGITIIGVILLCEINVEYWLSQNAIVIPIEAINENEQNNE